MSANYSIATRTYDYQPTIIEHRLLLSRLAIQIAFVKNEFRSDPRAFARQLLHSLLSNRTAMLALAVVAGAMMLLLLVDCGVESSTNNPADADEQRPEVVLMTLTSPMKLAGSGQTLRPSHGGGSGGDGNPVPQQTGKLPPSSSIVAPIPIAPPIHPPALPVAGIDIDPALWQDIKAPVYGDPTSKSEIPSKGPGEDGGIGTDRGLGVGIGRGPGAGPGTDGNSGGGPRQIGCCGTGSSSDQGSWPLKGSEVDQRARLLSKPEPQYTEEARKNQITGTVTLRAIFSSSGEVVQIQALHQLPFGLTERAIAAARQIKFVPAMKGGRPVSVYMQLEYNFNLY